MQAFRKNTIKTVIFFLCRKKFDLQKESSNVIDNGYPSNGLFKSQKIRVMKRLVMMMMMDQVPETRVFKHKFHILVSKFLPIPI